MLPAPEEDVIKAITLLALLLSASALAGVDCADFSLARASAECESLLASARTVATPVLDLCQGLHSEEAALACIPLSFDRAYMRGAPAVCQAAREDATKVSCLQLLASQLLAPRDLARCASIMAVEDRAGLECLRQTRRLGRIEI